MAKTSDPKPVASARPIKRAFATDDFIRVVKDLSDLCGRQIGAVPLLLENAVSTPKQRIPR